MKKIVNILFAAAVVALAMVSCQKNIQEESIIEKEAIESPIHFYAEEVATKTVFGSPSGTNYPTLWTNTYNIKISENLGGKENNLSPVQAVVVPASEGQTASFTYTPSSNIKDDGSASYVFYAVSPAVAFTSFSKSNVENKRWSVTVAANQTPTAKSVDEKVQLIVAQSSEFNSFPSSVSFSFSHITAYGKLSLVNFTPEEGETVSSISLTAPENWVGTYNWYPVDMTGHDAGSWDATSASKTITINTSATEDVWFACVPVDLGGKVVNLEVTTNKGIYTKNITIPAGKKFEAGKIASFGIDMGSVTRTDPDAYSIAEIKALYSDTDVVFTAKLTDALVTLVSGSNFYLQDASGAILVYTSGHGLAAGDKLNGLILGTLTKYQGNYEITGFASTATKTTGNVVTPTTVAHATLVDDFAEYESEYVKVEGLTVSEVDGKDITVSENANLKVRNETGNDITVGSKINAVGAACYYNSTKQVKIFSLAEEDKLAIGSVITASNKSVNVGNTVPIGATTNSPATITYASDDETVATVDASGVISGVKAGTATITCSVAASGKYTATSKDIIVTVSAASEPKEHVATINFNSSATKINAASVTGDDSEGNTWTITTVGTTSYTANSAYYQVGSSSKPATSITFTTTLASSATNISLEAKFGGFSGTAGTVALKVGDTSIGTGSLNAKSDVVVESSTTGAGTVLTVTVTGIAKGVKCYYIKATYTN